MLRGYSRRPEALVPAVAAAVASGSAVTPAASAMPESPVREASAVEGSAAEEERRRRVRAVTVPVGITVGVPVGIAVGVGIGFVLRIGRLDGRSRCLSRIVVRLVAAIARTGVEAGDSGDVADHGLAYAGLAQPDEVAGAHVRVEP